MLCPAQLSSKMWGGGEVIMAGREAKNAKSGKWDNELGGYDSRKRRIRCLDL